MTDRNFEKFDKAYLDALTELHESVSKPYVKKSVEVDAVQVDKPTVIHTLEGDVTANPTDWIITGVNGEQYPCSNDVFIKGFEASGTRWKKRPRYVTAWQTDKEIILPHNNETLTASKGDWIVKQPEGNLVPVKPDIFVKTYDKCEE